MEHKSLLIYLDNEDMFAELTDEEAGRVIKALLHYSATGEIPVFDERAVRFAFSKLRKDVDRNSLRYAERCAKNKEIALRREWDKKNPNGTDEDYEEYKRRKSAASVSEEVQRQRQSEYRQMVARTAAGFSM